MRHNLRADFAQWKLAANPKKKEEEEVSPSQNGAVGLLFLQLKVEPNSKSSLQYPRTACGAGVGRREGAERDQQPHFLIRID